MASRTIIASGVSKSYAWTGGRIGWAVFPTVAEAHVFKNLNINYISCTSAYNQFGAKVAIESPLSPLWMERMCAAFQERRNFMVTGLNKIPGITCRNPRGAFYLFPNIADVCMKLGVITAHARMPESARQRTSPATMFQMFLLWRHRIATMDRRSFGRIGSEGEHYLRLSIATALNDLKIALEQIRIAVNDEDGFQDFVRVGQHLW